jgi:hypothetical protein
VIAPVSDLQLAESRHRYKDPRTGQLTVSVTSVVSNLDTGDKLGAGAGAAVKLTKAGVDYRKVWNDKRDLGSRVHGYASLWAEGKTADVLEGDGPYLDAFQAFCQAKNPQWIESERAVVHSSGYGGRFDLIGEIDGLAYLLDLKCGKPYPLELSLQVSAYRYADGMIRYSKDGTAVMLEPMPHIERCAGLYLDETGTAKLVEVDADNASFEAFLHLLAVRQWCDRVKKVKP